MTSQQARMDDLTHEQCLALLGRNSFGRLAVVEEGQPDVFPVNYSLDGERIIFCSGAGTKLDHASLDRVAFEVDEIDLAHQHACSVVVRGTAREFTDAIDEASERERTLAPPTWFPALDTHWIRIVPRSISGRQIVRG